MLAALGDPVRLEIIRQLAHAEDVNACDFEVRPPVSQPTLSHHLRILREAGLVRTERCGTHVHYRLDAAAFGRLGTLFRSLGSPSPATERTNRGVRQPTT